MAARAGVARISRQISTAGLAGPTSSMMTSAELGCAAERLVGVGRPSRDL